MIHTLNCPFCSYKLNPVREHPASGKLVSAQGLLEIHINLYHSSQVADLGEDTVSEESLG